MGRGDPERRIARITLGARATALALAFCFASALAADPAPAQEAGPPDPPEAAELVGLDSAMLAIATLVTENAARIDSVWPGFWSPPEFILFRAAGPTALLYSAEGPLPGYAPLEGEAIPAVLRGKSYARSGIIPEVRRFKDRDSDLPWLLDLDRAPSEDVLSLVDALLHETFHRWQERAFDREISCVPQWYPRSLALPAGFRDAVAEELSLLRAAVLEEDDARQAARASAYLESRMRRLSGALPLVAHIEDRQALREGTARFVGNAGHLMAQQRSLAALPDTLARALDRLHARALDPDTAPASEQAGRMYGAGAAVVYLLERLAPRGWRMAAQQGRPLDALLAQHVGFQDYLDWADALPNPEESCPGTQRQR